MAGLSRDHVQLAPLLGPRPPVLMWWAVLTWTVWQGLVYRVSLFE
jgi:hypothetical protein